MAPILSAKAIVIQKRTRRFKAQILAKGTLAWAQVEFWLGGALESQERAFGKGQPVQNSNAVKFTQAEIDTAREVQARGLEVSCPRCGKPMDVHVFGECPESIQAHMLHTTQVLERYMPRARAQMKMSMDISKLTYLMSLYKGDA